MSDDALLDLMDARSLRALVQQLRRERDMLLTERETHLRQVEQAFTRRHNQQQARIVGLEKQLNASRRAAS